MLGLGANLPEDAIYPITQVSGDGRALTGQSRYLMRFLRGQEPPVGAFWSLTLYDAQGFQVANPINRFAIGDRDPLVRDADGTIELLIQHADPGGERKANWLPAPDGPFNLTLRLYAPLAPALDGRWTPPPVQLAEAPREAPGGDAHALRYVVAPAVLRAPCPVCAAGTTCGIPGLPHAPVCRFGSTGPAFRHQRARHLIEQESTRIGRHER
ncbi:DUF1214 domain-containing protein [Dankookia sp. P2]|uniref:DUF1214 domain-containing protein n=1 Tax=Dankookia sp. P2 TaxID=3423955 RepID=UPI003D66DBC8